MFAKYKTDLDNLEKEEMPEKRELKEYLGDCFKNLKVVLTPTVILISELCSDPISLVSGG